MGNIFSAGDVDLSMSNGSTGVFFDVLTLAGCAIAETPWERNLALYFADGDRIGLGISGFDLADLPWTGDWPAEKAFLERMVDLALTRHGWTKLSYDPPFIAGQLAEYRTMVAGFTPSPGSGDWTVPPDPSRTARCAVHDLYVGDFGCRLCGS